MTRVLLVIPTTTYRAPEFLEAARRLGVEVVLASDAEQAFADRMGDRFLELRLDRPEQAAAAIVERAKVLPLDAIVAVDDVGSLAAARAASELGLRTNPVDAVAATRDKSRLRQLCAGAGIRQPDFRLVARTRDEAVGAAAALGLPVVVKPVSLSGSRGVIRADSLEEVAEAAARTSRIIEAAGGDEDERMLVESYVPGREIAVEGLLDDGVLEVLAFFDKPDPLTGPFFEETIYVTPSSEPASVLEATRALVAATATALGLRNGPVHAECRLTPTNETVEPVLLELAARTIGGKCATALRFATGQSLEEIVLAQALGRPIARGGLEAGASGVMMVPIPHSGRFLGADLEAARATDLVTAIEWNTPRGAAVVALPEGDRYLGFVFARGLDTTSVTAALRLAHHRLAVTIEPD